MRDIIGIVGMSAAEKTVVVRILSRLSGITTLRMSEVIEEEILEERGNLEPTKYKEMSEYLREKFGGDVIARRTLEKARDRGLSSVIIDGLRSLEEVNLLRSRSKNLILVCVHSSPIIRHKRLMSNEIGPRSLSKDECEDLDSHNLALGIGDVIAIADRIIINDEFRSENLEMKVRNLYSEIKNDLIKETQ